MYREAVITILTLGTMIVVTLVGNILVILSVLNHTPLKILSNYFVVSLAVADLMVRIASWSQNSRQECQLCNSRNTLQCSLK